MKTLQITAALSLATLATGAASAQDLLPSSPAQQLPIIITGATVHTVSGETIEDGYVLFENGVITDVGQGDRAVTGITNVIAADGMHVYPGLIAPVSQVGLVEFNAIPQSDDRDERGPVTPEAQAWVAVNPDSTLLPVTRLTGVLTVNAVPTSGDIPGTASLIRMDGWTNDDLTIKEQAGIVINWPRMRPIDAWWMDDSDEEQLKSIRRRVDRIDTYFQDAKAYDAARDADESTPIDLRLEAARPCFEEQDPMPVMISAADIDQINAAVTWAVDLGLRPIVIGGRDAPLCAELLKRHDVPVIIDGLIGFPKRADLPYDHAFTLPQRLDEAGVRWCVGSGERDGNERNLPHHTGLSVAYGLDQDAAIRGMTLSPAEILGIAETHGSLDAGKAATLFIADGNILEVTTTVTHAFIDGREVILESKQTELRDKYREKYRQLGITE